MNIQDDATIQAGQAAPRHGPASRDDALDRAAQALSRMDEALATLRSRNPQPRPGSAGPALASNPGDDHEYR